jgi:hypothetical protein
MTAAQFVLGAGMNSGSSPRFVISPDAAARSVI